MNQDDLKTPVFYTADTMGIFLNFPEPKWEVSMTQDFYMRASLPTAPNAFHRWMLKRFFGIHWRKIK